MKSIEEKARLNLQYERDFLGHNLSEDMVCRAYIAGANWMFENVVILLKNNAKDFSENVDELIKQFEDAIKE